MKKYKKNVIIKSYEECKRWYYPESSKIYEFVELASTTSLPFSKAFEITVQNTMMNVKDGIIQKVQKFMNL